mgnify:FL=1|jgi:COP9 signalosome complex subunit 7
MLTLFASGSWHEYKHAPPGTYSPLSPTQSVKLKQLTLLSLASKTRILTYDTVAAATDSVGDRDVEDLVITALDEGMLSARLDGLARHILIDAVSPRDVLPSSLETLKASLRAWELCATNALDAIDQRIAELHAELQSSARDRELQHKTLVMALEEARAAMNCASTGMDTKPTGSEAAWVYVRSFILTLDKVSAVRSVVAHNLIP